MHSRSLLYKKILKDYDKKRQLSQRKLWNKLSQVYEIIPEIKKIDEELNSTGFKLAKLSLSKDSDLKRLIEEIKEKNKFLKEKKGFLLEKYGFSRDFLNPEYECTLCNDTGYVDNKKCTCFKQQLINQSYSKSNIEEIIKVENFSNFNYDYYSANFIGNNISPLENMKIIVSKCYNFIQTFKNSFQSFLFYGKTGLGKTFLCNCIAKEILDRGHTVLYLSSFQLFQIFEKYRFFSSKETEKENRDAVNSILECDLLIIDDLGSEFSTALTTVELFNCLNTRLINKKPTIISTNLPPKDLKEKYKDRIASRIFGNYEVCKFYGTDIRMNKAAQ